MYIEKNPHVKDKVKSETILLYLTLYNQNNIQYIKLSQQSKQPQQYTSVKPQTSK
jgi:hypothetical protein